MPMYKVKNLCETSRNKLREVCGKLEGFLNHHTLHDLMGEVKEDEVLEEYYRGFLSDLRHLSVYCEVTYEKLGVSLRRANFNVEFAEKNLHNVVHLCVNHFFYPKSEAYQEDGRYAYTGHDAIIFRKEPNPELKNLIIDLSKTFEFLREELSYYETDYVTQRRMQGDPVQQ